MDEIRKLTMSRYQSHIGSKNKGEDADEHRVTIYGRMKNGTVA